MNGFGMFGRLGDVHDGQAHLDDAVALRHRHFILRKKILRGLRMQFGGNGHHAFE